jgi:hypothetical protein
MVSTSPQYTILLSMRSPILAPLYLAKVRGGTFRNIDFKYAFELPRPTKGTTFKEKDEHKQSFIESFYDPLAEAVLSKALENSRYIAGVAHPVRSIISTDGSLYRPRVIAGLIRHQTFWLATDDAELKTDTGEAAASKCDYIVSQPMYTSGFATLQKFLKIAIQPDDVSLKEGIIRHTGDDGKQRRLYFKTMPGFERYYYQHLVRKSCRKDKYAYLTTDPSDHEGPLVQFASLNGCPDTRNSLMTALFCGNGWSVRNPMLFNDICNDVIKALKAIHDDPVRAALELKDYSEVSQDRFMSFSNKTLPHERLVQILEDLSIRDEIYCNDLTITLEQITRGFKLRSPLSPMAQEITFEEYIEFFAPGVVSRQEPEPRATSAQYDRERTEDMPDFVRYSIQNYRQFVDKQYEINPSETRTGEMVNTLRQLSLDYGKNIVLLSALALSFLALACAFGVLERLHIWSVVPAALSFFFVLVAVIIKHTSHIDASWFSNAAVTLTSAIAGSVLFFKVVVSSFLIPESTTKRQAFIGIVLCLDMFPNLWSFRYCDPKQDRQVVGNLCDKVDRANNFTFKGEARSGRATSAMRGAVLDMCEM